MKSCENCVNGDFCAPGAESLIIPKEFQWFREAQKLENLDVKNAYDEGYRYLYDREKYFPFNKDDNIALENFNDIITLKNESDIDLNYYLALDSGNQIKYFDGFSDTTIIPKNSYNS